MKRILTLMAALGLPLAGLTACTADQVLQAAPVIGKVCAATEATLIDEKTVYAANALYNVPAQAHVVANRARQLSPAVKTAVKPKLLTMYRLLGTVKAAQGSFSCDYGAMKRLNADVTALLPKRN